MNVDQNGNKNKQKKNNNHIIIIIVIIINWKIEKKTQLNFNNK